MRILQASFVGVLLLAVWGMLAADTLLVEAKKSSRPVSRSSRPRPSSSSGGGSRRPATSRRRPVVEEEEDEEDDFLGGVEEEEDEEFVMDDYEEDFMEEDEEEEMPPPRKSRPSSSSSRRGPSSSSSRRRPPPSFEDDEEEDDRYSRPRPRSSGRRGPPSRGPPPSRRGGRSSGRGSRSVVRYNDGPSGAAAAASFVTGLTSSLRNNLPDPKAVQEAVGSSLKVARETTSGLSANLYREVKGLTSSELEQVMLKSTRPDDTAVKGKHVERLVGVTYQISGRYDIYDAVLRKLWGKMAEKDWRTTIKALYILHRFSGDGAPDHAPALKARLRELRRTRDPKRKDKYFNSKQLLAGDARPDTVPFRAFMSRYAHYVLLRAQCFCGMFDEILSEPKPVIDKKKKSASAPAVAKPITSTSLRAEHLEAAAMLLKAGVACQLKDGEACENTAIAVERVVSDMIALSKAVAVALNRALKDPSTADAALLKKWCLFYRDELLPQTKAMVKKSAPKLDAFGLFLPSRMGTTVAPEVLEKALATLDESSPATTSEEEAEPASEPAAEAEPAAEEVDDEDEEEDPEEGEAEEEPEEEAAIDEDDQGEYEYDVEEYYDDEEL